MHTKDAYTPEFFLRVLISIILVLLLANIFGIILWLHLPDSLMTERIITIFDFNQIFNVHTIFTSSLFLMATILLFKIGRVEAEISTPWYGLAFFFLFLTGSKAFQIQEFFIWFLRNGNHDDMISKIVLAIISILVLILLLTTYIPFITKLHSPTLRLMAFSMAIFIIGGFGLDYLGGLYRELHGYDLTYKIYYTVEETLEMVGISLFIYSLKRYLHLWEGKGGK